MSISGSAWIPGWPWEEQLEFRKLFVPVLEWQPLALLFLCAAQIGVPSQGGAVFCVGLGLGQQWGALFPFLHGWSHPELWIWAGMFWEPSLPQLSSHLPWHETQLLVWFVLLEHPSFQQCMGLVTVWWICSLEILLVGALSWIKVFVQVCPVWSLPSFFLCIDNQLH